MNKAAARNVYALRGVPFVMVKGHRLYARTENTACSHGVKVFCSEPKFTKNSLTVKVLLDGGTIETWGGKFSSSYVEPIPAPVPRKKVFKGFFKHPCM